MIEYEGRAWLSIIFRTRGSVIPRLWSRILLAGGLGVVAQLLLQERGVKIPTLAHTLVGVALGLLLVFRTNASYDRYWEGRRLLGAIVNRSRDLARQLVAYVPAGELRATLGRLVIAHYRVVAQTLQRQDDLAALGALLTPDERAALAPHTHRAPIVLTRISAALRAEADAGRLTEPRLQLLDANLTALADALGGCERILRTPIPFAYAQHIKVFVVLFCFSAPFAMADVMGWITPFASALLATALFGIDEIGVEIEDPFGDDPNDLPVAAIGKGIEAAVTQILAAGEA
jgi:putative membrane protein